MNDADKLMVEEQSPETNALYLHRFAKSRPLEYFLMGGSQKIRSAIPCVVLGSTLAEGVKIDDARLAKLRIEAGVVEYTYVDGQAISRKFVDRNQSGSRNEGFQDESTFFLSKLTGEESWMPSGNQEGGNGSGGGDANRGVYQMDMIDGRASVSFWRHEKMGALDPLFPAPSSDDVKGEYANLGGAMLAMVFLSHEDAMIWITKNAEALAVYTDLRIVGARLKLS